MGIGAFREERALEPDPHKWALALPSSLLMSLEAGNSSVECAIVKCAIELMMREDARLP